jgi:hypothetical protein
MKPLWRNLFGILFGILLALAILLAVALVQETVNEDSLFWNCYLMALPLALSVKGVRKMYHQGGEIVYHHGVYR